MFDQLPIQYNPFKEAFDNGPLDFDVREGLVTLNQLDHGENEVLCNRDNKAIIRDNEYGTRVQDWWIVGKGYFVKSHRDFYTPIWDKILENFDPNDVAGVEIKYKSARNGRWGMMDLVFPNIGVPITTTNGFETTIKLRIVCWSGLDGTTANNYMLGAIDSFCTNGQVFTKAADKDGAITKLYKRNSKLFDMDSFALSLTNSADTFYQKAREYQYMATKPLGWDKGSAFIDSFKSLSDSKKEGLKFILGKEFTERGHNIFALHSALTNYSSHNNQMDYEGKSVFRSRKSKHGDMEHKVLFDREVEVLSILESKQWQELLVAA